VRRNSEDIIGRVDRLRGRAERWWDAPQHEGSANQVS
jgi:hypothetical protein